MNAEPPLHSHQDNSDHLGINDGSLNDGSRGTILNMVASNTAHKTLVFVKLTDSALKAIDDYFKAKKLKSDPDGPPSNPSIKFDESSNRGTLSFPSLKGQDSQWKCYGFSLSPLNSEGPQGSFECIRERKSHHAQHFAGRKPKSIPPNQGHLLESLGQMAYKMQVHACEDSYQNTRERMVDMTQKTLTKSAKEITQTGPNIGRKVKLPKQSNNRINGQLTATQQDKTNLNSKASYKPFAKASLPSGGASSSISDSSLLNHHRLTSPALKVNGHSVSSPGSTKSTSTPSPPDFSTNTSIKNTNANNGNSLTPNLSPGPGSPTPSPRLPNNYSSASTSSISASSASSPNPEAMRRPLKDRIIHLLAVRPFKKPEIFSRLQKEGLKDKDRKTLTHVLSSVSEFRNNSFYLRSIHWNDVRPDDWPFYTPQEREEVKKRNPLNKTSVNGSSTAASQQHSLSVPPAHFQRAGSRSPSNQSDKSHPSSSPAVGSKRPPNPNSNGGNPTCKRSRKDDAGASRSSLASSNKSLNVNGRPSSQSPDPNRFGTLSQQNGFTNGYHTPSDTEDMQSGPRSPPSPRTHHLSISQKTGNGSINGEVHPNSNLISSNATGNSGPKVESSSSARYSSGAQSKSRMQVNNQSQEHQFSNEYNGSMNRNSSKQPSQSCMDTSASACHNGISNNIHHTTVGGRGSLNSTPNSSPDSGAGSTSAVSYSSFPDYKSMYTKISNPEQRKRYEMEFNRDYDEYYRQHSNLDSIKKKFTNYERQLNQYDESSDEWQRIVEKIFSEYEALKNDSNWTRTRQQVQFLHNRLNHIRQLILEYDKAESNCDVDNDEPMENAVVNDIDHGDYPHYMLTMAHLSQ